MNSLKRYREEILISKAELARKAGLSVLTIDRIEKGKSCHLATKKKIILALGMDLSKEHRNLYKAGLSCPGTDLSHLVFFGV